MNNFIKKIFKNKKLVSFSILGILVVSFLIPGIAHADLFGVMDIFGMQLDALDFLDNTTRKYVVVIELVILQSIGYLQLGSSLLDFAMVAPIDATQNLLVISGWKLVSGLANLVIIVSFVWTALKMIIQGDSAKGQSSLIRLVVAALLINFSMFIMGGLIDVAEFIKNGIMNTLTGEVGGLTNSAQLVLNKYSWVCFWAVFPTFITSIMGSLVPVLNVVATVIGGITFVVMASTGWLFVLIFTICLNFILGTTFLVLAAIFAMRIVFLWILTILAPLAVVTYKTDLPILNKFFPEWSKLLVEWLFAGVALVFFLGLGLKFLTITGGAGSMDFSKVSTEGGFRIEPFLINYLFVFIYLVAVCVIMSKKWMPEMGQEIMNAAMSFGGKLNKVVGSRLKKDIKKVSGRKESVLDLEAQDKGTLDSGLFEEKWSKSRLSRGVDSGLGGVYAVKRRLKGEIPGAASREMAGEIKKDSEKYKGLTAKQFAGNISQMNTVKGASAFMGMSSGERNKFVQENQGNRQMMDKLFAVGKILPDKDSQGSFQRSLIISKATDEENEDRLRRAYVSTDKDKQNNPISRIENVIRNTSGEQVLEINTKAIDNSPQILEAISKYWKGPEFAAKGKKDGEFVDLINKRFDEVIEGCENSGNFAGKKYLTANTSMYGKPPKIEVGVNVNFDKDSAQTQILDFTGEEQTRISDYPKNKHIEPSVHASNGGEPGKKIINKKA